MARQAADQAAVHSSRNLATAIERDVARNVKVYDLSLLSVQEGMHLPGIRSAESYLAIVNKELADLATTDPLTGLANRRRFGNMLRREWRRGERDRSPIGLLPLDVDNFKAFNGHYGHGADDECLKRVAATIKDSVRRPYDLAARYGAKK